jgi:hypothetical protein
VLDDPRVAVRDEGLLGEIHQDFWWLQSDPRHLVQEEKKKR